MYVLRVLGQILQYQQEDKRELFRVKGQNVLANGQYSNKITRFIFKYSVDILNIMYYNYESWPGKVNGHKRIWRSTQVAKGGRL